METDAQLGIHSRRQAIVVLNQDFCVRTVNDAFCRCIGRSRSELEALHLSELLYDPGNTTSIEERLEVDSPDGRIAETHVAQCRLRGVGDRAILADVLSLEERGYIVIAIDDASATTEGQDEVSDITARLTMAKDRERLRIASLLHDDVQQRLFAVGLRLSAMKGDLRSDMSDGERTTLEEIQDSVIETRQILRSMAAALSPPILLDEGLSDALMWLAARVKRQFGLQVRLLIEQPSPSLVDEIRVLLYRCVHELLFNVVQHAGTLDASVIVRNDSDDLEIVVEDRGTGFDADEAAGRARRGESLGLSSLRQELGHFGGSLDVFSSREDGTRVVIRVPMRCTLNVEADYQ